jgi:hypothetical protein
MNGLVTEFNPLEFSIRYIFRGGKVYRRGRPDPVKAQHRENQQGHDYWFYRLTRNDGIRVRVSSTLVSGRVVKVGDLYIIQKFPRGYVARPGWPAYLFNSGKRKVMRVGFQSPRVEAVVLKPNKCVQYRLYNLDGGYTTLHEDDLFL